MASKKEEKDTIKARTKAPKNKKDNRGKVLFLRIIFLIVLTTSSVIASQLLIGYLMIWILGSSTFEQPVWTAIYSALSYLVALGFMVFVVPKILRKKEGEFLRIGRDEIGLKGLPTWTDLGLAPIGFFAYLLLSGVLVSIFSLFPWFDVSQAQDVGFSVFISGFDRALAFITLVIVAPIAEEIIFRGWLYGKMRNEFLAKFSERSSMIASIILVSLLFGALHMQWNVGVNVFAMSIIMCILREITGTIYSGIILHMIKNGVAFYLLYVLGT